MALTPKEGSGRMLRNQIIQTMGRQRFPRREPGGGPVAGPAAWHPALCHRLTPRAAGPADPGAGGAAPAAGSAPGARPPESPWFGPAAPGASRHAAGGDTCRKRTARQTRRTESLRMCTRHAVRFNEKDSNGKRANIRHVYKTFNYVIKEVTFKLFA